MFKTLLVAAIVVACADAQKCVSVDYTTKGGLCDGYKIAGKVCMEADHTSVLYPMLDAASNAATTVAACQAQLGLTCATVSGKVKSGACDGGKSSPACSTLGMAFGYDMAWGACGSDSDCSSSQVYGVKGSTYKKGSKIQCCSVYDTYLTDICTGIDSNMVKAAKDLAKSLGQCADSDCYSSASSIAMSLLLPLVAAAATLLATIY